AIRRAGDLARILEEEDVGRQRLGHRAQRIGEFVPRAQRGAAPAVHEDDRGVDGREAREHYLATGQEAVVPAPQHILHRKVRQVVLRLRAPVYVRPLAVHGMAAILLASLRRYNRTRASRHLKGCYMTTRRFRTAIAAA